MEIILISILPQGGYYEQKNSTSDSIYLCFIAIRVWFINTFKKY